jgi:hypothetical protein
MVSASAFSTGSSSSLALFAYQFRKTLSNQGIFLFFVGAVIVCELFLSR